MKKKIILAKESGMKNITVSQKAELIFRMIYQEQQRRVLAYSNIWKRPMLTASQERKLKCIIQNRDS